MSPQPATPEPQERTSRTRYLPANEGRLSFPPQRTALLVIDPVNDFLSEGGAAWDLTENTVKLHNVVENLQRAIEGARERGVPVLFGPMAYTEEDYAEASLQRRTGINRIMFERKMFLAGTWGADFHPNLQPQEDEVVLLPHKGTDVFETDLPDHLHRMNTTHLVIAGMTANLCCESTGRRAAEAGYDVTFLSDAIGSENLPSYEAAMKLNFPLIGNSVMKVDEFLAAIGDQSGETDAVQTGDEVLGSDQMKIGEIREVVAATDDTDGYLLVPRGVIFETDTYIPLDAVTRRAGTRVFVNVPKLVVGKMGWDSPPARAGQQSKHGAPAQEVERLYRSRGPSVQTAPANREHLP